MKKQKKMPYVLLFVLVMSFVSTVNVFADEGTGGEEEITATAEVTEEVPTEVIEAVLTVGVTEDVFPTVVIDSTPTIGVASTEAQPANNESFAASVITSGNVGSQTTNPNPVVMNDANGNNNLDDDCSHDPDCLHGSGNGSQHVIVSTTPLDYISLHTGSKYGHLHYFDLTAAVGTTCDSALYCVTVTYDAGTGYTYTITNIKGQDISNTQGWLGGTTPTPQDPATATFTPDPGTPTFTATAQDNTGTPSATVTVTPGTSITATSSSVTGTPTDVVTPSATFTVTPSSSTGTPGVNMTPTGGATPVAGPTAAPNTGVADFGSMQLLVSLFTGGFSLWGLLDPKRRLWAF